MSRQYSALIIIIINPGHVRIQENAAKFFRTEAVIEDDRHRQQIVRSCCKNMKDVCCQIVISVALNIPSHSPAGFRAYPGITAVDADRTASAFGPIGCRVLIRMLV